MLLYVKKSHTLSHSDNSLSLSTSERKLIPNLFWKMSLSDAHHSAPLWRFIVTLASSTKCRLRLTCYILAIGASCKLNRPTRVGYSKCVVVSGHPSRLRCWLLAGIDDLSLTYANVLSELAFVENGVWGFTDSLTFLLPMRVLWSICALILMFSMYFEYE